MLVTERRFGAADYEDEPAAVQRVAASFLRSKPRPLACSLFVTLLMLPGISLGNEPEIHRCLQEDGTIAFQEMPCPEPEDASETDSQDNRANPPQADAFFDFVNPYDEAEQAPAPTEAARQTPLSQDRAECEKTTRAAIDAIDLVLRKDYSEDASKAYLAELLELTRQLRACKQL